MSDAASVEQLRKLTRDRLRRAANSERIRAQQKAWHTANREAVLAKMKAWHALNSERLKVKKRAQRKAEPDKARASAKKWYEANSGKATAAKRLWYAANRARVNAASAARRAGLKRATPAWVDHAAIRQAYDLAALLGMHVDHIHPLKGENFCGLHVPWNLQLLTASDNVRKSNNMLSVDSTV